MTESKSRIRATTIAAAFAGISGLITAVGGQIMNYVDAQEARTAQEQQSKELKAGHSLQVQEAYLRLREALIKERSGREQLAEKVAALELKLWDIATRPPARTRRPAEPKPPAPTIRASRDGIADLLDELPDEVPYPNATEVQRTLDGLLVEGE